MDLLELAGGPVTRSRIARDLTELGLGEEPLDTMTLLHHAEALAGAPASASWK